MTATSFLVGQTPNILFIAVDDMNCDFGAYGNREVHSPNLDDLAAEGVLFANNHCQQPVCGASRASLLSGFTPEHTEITSFYMYLRDMYPDVVTLPQFFKNSGYITVGMGKIHDPRNVSETDGVDLVSWSNFINITGSRWVVSSGTPVTEMADLPDNSYVDGKIADEGVRQIQNLASNSEPFFLAVGFKKPHLPFVAPKKYWDIYDRDSISLAPYREWAENDVEFVHNPGAEFFNGYDNVPPMGDWSYDIQREYRHGYYACVSFIDQQVGRLIDELKNQGIYDNTIIVLWGDHGFSLGDHSNWGKHTNFEYATRSPLIIKAPGLSAGVVSQSPSELLDIYPTLVDLAGFSVPDTLDGNSLVPILKGETDQVKSFAVSQYRRGGNQGFVLRSNYYQYVEWIDDDLIQHQQLFNFEDDPYQTANLAFDPAYQQMVDTFSFNLNRYLDEGINTAPIFLTSDTDSLDMYANFRNLSFSVHEKENQVVSPLLDAEITIDPYNLPSSAAGYAALNLQPGTYSYTISKEDYWPASGMVDLSVDTVVCDTLLRHYYYLRIEIVDSAKLVPLTGIELEFNGVSYISGLDGSIDVRIEPGTYNLLFQSADYKNIERLIDVYTDSILLLKLKSEGIPDDLLKKLEDITNTTMVSPREQDFVDFIEETIGDEQTARYKSLILKYGTEDYRILKEFLFCIGLLSVKQKLENNSGLI